jgi:hypothetical protein
MAAPEKRYGAAAGSGRHARKPENGPEESKCGGGREADEALHLFSYCQSFLS